MVTDATASDGDNHGVSNSGRSNSDAQVVPVSSLKPASKARATSDAGNDNSGNVSQQHHRRHLVWCKWRDKYWWPALYYPTARDIVSELGSRFLHPDRHRRLFAALMRELRAEYGCRVGVNARHPARNVQPVAKLLLPETFLSPADGRAEAASDGYARIMFIRSERDQIRRDFDGFLLLHAMRENAEAGLCAGAPLYPVYLSAMKIAAQHMEDSVAAVASSSSDESRDASDDEEDEIEREGCVGSAASTAATAAVTNPSQTNDDPGEGQPLQLQSREENAGVDPASAAADAGTVIAAWDPLTKRDLSTREGLADSSGMPSSTMATNAATTTTAAAPVTAVASTTAAALPGGGKSDTINDDNDAMEIEAATVRPETAVPPAAAIALTARRDEAAVEPVARRTTGADDGAPVPKLGTDTPAQEEQYEKDDASDPTGEEQRHEENSQKTDAENTTQEGASYDANTERTGKILLDDRGMVIPPIRGPVIHPNDSWDDVWNKLSYSGWNALTLQSTGGAVSRRRRPRRRGRTVYIKPGHSYRHGVPGSDYLQSLSELQSYCQKYYGWQQQERERQQKHQQRRHDSDRQSTPKTATTQTASEQGAASSSSTNSSSSSGVDYDDDGSSSSLLTIETVDRYHNSVLWPYLKRKRGWKCISSRDPLLDWLYITPWGKGIAAVRNGDGVAGADYFTSFEAVIEWQRARDQAKKERRRKSRLAAVHDQDKEVLEEEEEDVTDADEGEDQGTGETDSGSQEDESEENEDAPKNDAGAVIATPENQMTQPQDPAKPRLASGHIDGDAVSQLTEATRYNNGYGYDDDDDQYHWKTLWPKLKLAGWMYVKSRNALQDWWYLRPGRDKKAPGTEGEDYFPSEQDVIDYVREQDRADAAVTAAARRGRRQQQQEQEQRQQQPRRRGSVSDTASANRKCSHRGDAGRDGADDNDGGAGSADIGIPEDENPNSGHERVDPPLCTQASAAATDDVSMATPGCSSSGSTVATDATDITWRDLKALGWFYGSNPKRLLTWAYAPPGGKIHGGVPGTDYFDTIDEAIAFWKQRQQQEQGKLQDTMIRGGRGNGDRDDVTWNDLKTVHGWREDKNPVRRLDRAYCPPWGQIKGGVAGVDYFDTEEDAVAAFLRSQQSERKSRGGADYNNNGGGPSSSRKRKRVGLLSSEKGGSLRKRPRRSGRPSTATQSAAKNKKRTNNIDKKGTGSSTKKKKADSQNKKKSNSTPRGIPVAARSRSSSRIRAHQAASTTDAGLLLSSRFVGVRVNSCSSQRSVSTWSSDGGSSVLTARSEGAHNSARGSWWKKEPVPDFEVDIWPILRKLGYTSRGECGGFLLPKWVEVQYSAPPTLFACSTGLRKFLCCYGIPVESGKCEISELLSENERDRFLRWVTFANVPGINPNNSIAVLKDVHKPAPKEIMTLLSSSDPPFECFDGRVYVPGYRELPGGKFGPEQNHVRGVHYFDEREDIIEGGSLRAYCRGAWQWGANPRSTKAQKDVLKLRLWAAVSSAPLPEFTGMPDAANLQELQDMTGDMEADGNDVDDDEENRLGRENRGKGQQVRCDNCEELRDIPQGVLADDLPDVWYCAECEDAENLDCDEDLPDTMGPFGEEEDEESAWYYEESVPNIHSIWPILMKLGFTYQSGRYSYRLKTDVFGGEVATPEELRRKLLLQGVPSLPEEGDRGAGGDDVKHGLSEQQWTYLERWVKFAHVPVCDQNSLVKLRQVRRRTASERWGILSRLGMTRRGDRIFLPGGDHPVTRPEQSVHYVENEKELRVHLRSAEKLRQRSLEEDIGVGGRPRRRACSGRDESVVTEEEELYIRLWAATVDAPIPRLVVGPTEAVAPETDNRCGGRTAQPSQPAVDSQETPKSPIAEEEQSSCEDARDEQGGVLFGVEGAVLPGESHPTHCEAAGFSLGNETARGLRRVTLMEEDEEFKTRSELPGCRNLLTQPGEEEEDDEKDLFDDKGGDKMALVQSVHNNLSSQPGAEDKEEEDVHEGDGKRKTPSVLPACSNLLTQPSVQEFSGGNEKSKNQTVPMARNNLLTQPGVEEEVSHSDGDDKNKTQTALPTRNNLLTQSVDDGKGHSEGDDAHGRGCFGDIGGHGGQVRGSVGPSALEGGQGPSLFSDEIAQAGSAGALESISAASFNAPGSSSSSSSSSSSDGLVSACVSRRVTMTGAKNDISPSLPGEAAGMTGKDVGTTSSGGCGFSFQRILGLE